MANASSLQQQAAALRGFSRFYTQRIGVLQPDLLASGLPLAAARTMFELGQQPEVTARALAERLAMDAGQLSRLLAGLCRKGLLQQRPAADRRSKRLMLSARGQRLYRELDRRSQRQAQGFLEPLPLPERERLAAALHTAQQLLGGGACKDARAPVVTLRQPRPGDMGWIVHRQGALYAAEYGWDATFEGLVAEIVAAFLARHDPRRERCWIAERAGEIVGSIFLVRESDRVAKLRLLYVEPTARGLGLGHRLVAECIAFARIAGYETITLYTNDVLIAARRIYQAAGFALAREWKHHSYGKHLTGQVWNLKL